LASVGVASTKQSTSRNVPHRPQTPQPRNFPPCHASQTQQYRVSSHQHASHRRLLGPDRKASRSKSRSDHVLVARQLVALTQYPQPASAPHGHHPMSCMHHDQSQNVGVFFSYLYLLTSIYTRREPPSTANVDGGCQGEARARESVLQRRNSIASFPVSAREARRSDAPAPLAPQLTQYHWDSTVGRVELLVAHTHWPSGALA
jgi:hypothetical protein